jgi:hypothetical protein
MQIDNCSTRAVLESLSGVATMVAPATGLRRRTRGQRLRDGVLPGLPGARLGGAPGRFARRPAALKRRPLGRRWWPVLQPCPRLRNGRTEAGRLGRPPVGPAPEVCRAPRRAPPPLPRDAAPRGGGGAAAGPHRAAPLAAERRPQGPVRPGGLGDRPDAPVSPGRPPVPAGHGEVAAGFIEALEARGLDALRGLCAGVERLGVRGTRRVLTRRPLGGTRTRRPAWARSRAQHCASVAAGCS